MTSQWHDESPSHFSTVNQQIVIIFSLPILIDRIFEKFLGPPFAKYTTMAHISERKKRYSDSLSNESAQLIGIRFLFVNLWYVTFTLQSSKITKHDLFFEKSGKSWEHKRKRRSALWALKVTEPKSHPYTYKIIAFKWNYWKPLVERPRAYYKKCEMLMTTFFSTVAEILNQDG